MRLRQRSPEWRAAEASTDEGDVDFDAARGECPELERRTPRCAGICVGAQSSHFAIAGMSGAIRRFHRSVRQEGDLVNRFELFCCARVGLLEVAIAAQDGAFGGKPAPRIFAQAGGGFLRVLKFVPLDYKSFAACIAAQVESASTAMPAQE